MAVLVTGGAGYIGSHVVLALLDRGHDVVVVDNLSTGFADAVPSPAKLIVGEVGDELTMRRVLRDHGISAVMHFAASTVVPDSVVDPLRYYFNNTVNTHALLSACVAEKVGGFVFSSTAAVYGEGDGRPISEKTPLSPISPYGASKAMSERILIDAAAAHDFPYVILRYFNVAGADPQGRAGQRTLNATHLIKVAAEAAVGRREGLVIFGTTYPTPDGTGIRDYIHVSDLAAAHLAALDHLRGGGPNLIMNCGYGHGYSVREVIAAVETDIGSRLTVTEAPARPGDAPEVIADITAIRGTLDWHPQYDDLAAIVHSAIENERSIMR